MTLYSDEVKRIVKSYDWPPGERLKIEFQDAWLGQSQYLIFRIFRDNFSSFDGIEQLRIAKMIGDLIPRLNSMGIPTRFDVAPGDGRIVR